MKYLLTTAVFLWSCLLMAQDNILDARENYNIGQQVTITGIITNDNDLGPIRYMQDETAGIAIYPGSWSNFSFEPVEGDEVEVTGTLKMYNGLLEIDPIASISLLSEDNPLPEPIVVTPSQLLEQYEGMLVQINDAVFSDGGNTFGSSTYNFTASGETGIIYVRNGSPLMGNLIPLGEVDIVGILSQFTYNQPATDGYQLLPRNMEDLILESAVNFASEVEQSNLSTTGFTVSWNTDVASSTHLEYGTTAALGTIVDISESVTEHAVNLTDLLPGTPYFVQAYSITGEDTIRSNTNVFSTVSESSGEIIAYFNQSVDNSYATPDNEAVNLNNAIEDTIIAYINRSMYTLDLAIYNNNRGAIAQAINNAAGRGVVVRYIAEGSNANIAVNDLNDNIPVLYRENATSSGMHNKFVVIDRNNVDSAIVITGSTNFTSNNLFDDYNNMIIVQDQSLARAYTLEFNEMWGADGNLPDAANSRFGEFKIKNTPEKFIIGGRNVELYFSPSDGTTAHIEEAIYTTNYDLYFASLVLTNDILANAIMDVANIFVQPVGIIETVNGSGSDVQELIDAGIEVLDFDPASPYQLHHKYAIIDQSQPLSDPTVITGSHNWSSSAESTNDENTLIIHDAAIANQYYQEFMARYNQVTVSVKEIHTVEGMKAYPNPATEWVELEIAAHRAISGSLAIMAADGKALLEKSFGLPSGKKLLRIPLNNLSPGIYFIQISGDWGTETTRIVVQ